MARPGGGALSADARGPGAASEPPADAPLDLHRGRGWLAAVHPAWRPALAAAGWLRRAPLEAGCRAEPFETGAGGGRGGVLRADLDSGTIVVRPLRRGGWLGPLLGGRLLVPLRPMAEARVTTRLLARGAPVPLAVLALAWRVGLGWKALVATEELPGARNSRAWLDAESRPAARRRAASAAGGALRRFHDAGGRHRDLHLGNLLVTDTGGTPPRIHVIDLDRARVGAPPSPRRRMRELMRLYRSLCKSGVADRARLAAAAFRTYCAGDRSLRGRMLRWRAVEALRIAVHSLAYRR